MTFFGTFVSGPLAGTTFVASTEGDGPDGSILSVLAALSIVTVTLLFAVIAPFAVWPILFQEMYEEFGTAPALLVGVSETIYCILRYRSAVRHWGTDFFSEMVVGTLFGAALLLVAMYGTAAYWNASMELGIDFGAFLQEAIRNNGIGGLISLLFVGALLAVIPSVIIHKLSQWSIKKIAAAL